MYMKLYGRIISLDLIIQICPITSAIRFLKCNPPFTQSAQMLWGSFSFKTWNKSHRAYQFGTNSYNSGSETIVSLIWLAHAFETRLLSFSSYFRVQRLYFATLIIKISADELSTSMYHRHEVYLHFACFVRTSLLIITFVHLFVCLFFTGRWLENRLICLLCFSQLSWVFLRREDLRNSCSMFKTLMRTTQRPFTALTPRKPHAKRCMRSLAWTRTPRASLATLWHYIERTSKYSCVNKLNTVNPKKTGLFWRLERLGRGAWCPPLGEGGMMPPPPPPPLDLGHRLGNGHQNWHA